ncbi:alcohol dehydrogenase catalytic domain-containing protein [Aeromicrobium endophyticum]|nr:alcohol dehydrogenase catalytic domain-containing protein [Aeromicrobium endophyticum]
MTETTTSGTMTALRLEAWGQAPVLRQVPVPVPGAEGVLLRVTAAGMCHSDLHVMDASAGQLPMEPPFTLGHEVAGTVESVGELVDAAWIGRPVVVHGVWGCGRCRRCLNGRGNYCLDRGAAIGNGLGRDGGLADFMAVPSTRFLVPADGIDPVQAAPLTDAALTAFHAIRPHLDGLAAGAPVLVVGAGGLGHFAVQLLAAHGVSPVVVDPKPEARDLASRLGASRTVADLAELAAGDVRFDLVLDFVGAQPTMDAAIALVAIGGDLVVVGGAGGVLSVGKTLGLPQGWSVSAPFWGPREDLEAVVDLARAGRLTAHTQTFALSDVLAAYDRLRAGEIAGRAVVVPGPSAT